MATERKLDIFQILKAADKGESDWFSQQSPEARKEFAPPVVARWASSVDGTPEAAAYKLWLVNERVNVNLYNLGKHPDLVFRLLATCGLGKPLKHQWIASHKRKGGANKAFDFLADKHPELSYGEVEILLGLYTKDMFSDYLRECGVQADPAKEILKAYDKLGK